MADLDGRRPDAALSGYFDSPTTAGRTFDIAPDGRRFLMIKQGGGEDAAPLIVVQNFSEELKRLAPTR